MSPSRRKAMPTDRLTLAVLPMPAKILATSVLVTLAIGLLGALGQIVVHDIIPTFYSDPAPPQREPQADNGGMDAERSADSGRGDLFADLKTAAPAAQKPFYEGEQFVWTLRWTHIHLFGINMIFILLGGITLLLDTSGRQRSWLIALPFVGVAVDIVAMWLKAFVSPAFFWLHLPGGGLFALVFTYVFVRAIWELWRKPT